MVPKPARSHLCPTRQQPASLVLSQVCIEEADAAAGGQAVRPHRPSRLARPALRPVLVAFAAACILALQGGVFTAPSRQPSLSPGLGGARGAPSSLAGSHLQHLERGQEVILAADEGGLAGLAKRLGDGLKLVGDGIKGLGEKLIKSSEESKAVETKRREDRVTRPSADNLPAVGGLFGGLLRPMLKIVTEGFGGLLKESQDETAKVLEAAERALLRSGRFGSRVQCGPVFSQSYSSLNINGVRSAQVQLQFQVKGETNSGTAACSAIIDSAGNVELKGLLANGFKIDTKDLAGSSGPGGVIDVER